MGTMNKVMCMYEYAFQPGSEEEIAVAQRCSEMMNCPAGCSCDSGTVDCSHRSLKEIPNDIPHGTVRLLLNDNKIEKIPAMGIFNRLPRLQQLDLSRNNLVEIEEGAFEGASSITTMSLAQNQLSSMNNRILRGLNGLESLNIFANDISCITPGAFDALRSLKLLNLISNPFNCNCHMGWFAEWIKDKGFLENGPRCAAPEALKNRPIHTLSQHDFQCSGEKKSWDKSSSSWTQVFSFLLLSAGEDDQGCLGVNYCPRSCTCTGTIVRCSHAKLKSIPDSIPKETSELYLDVNEIESIDTDKLKHLTSLTRL